MHQLTTSQSHWSLPRSMQLLYSSVCTWGSLRVAPISNVAISLVLSLPHSVGSCGDRSGSYQLAASQFHWSLPHCKYNKLVCVRLGLAPINNVAISLVLSLPHSVGSCGDRSGSYQLAASQSHWSLPHCNYNKLVCVRLGLAPINNNIAISSVPTTFR